LEPVALNLSYKVKGTVVTVGVGVGVGVAEAEGAGAAFVVETICTLKPTPGPEVKPPAPRALEIYFQGFGRGSLSFCFKNLVKKPLLPITLLQAMLYE
jgi:hypothetical protein